MQWAIYRVAPYGEIRADKRGAVFTANLMAMQAAQKIDDEEFGKVLSALMKYLPGIEAFEDIADMEALKRVRERKDATN